MLGWLAHARSSAMLSLIARAKSVAAMAGDQRSLGLRALVVPSLPACTQGHPVAIAVTGYPQCECHVALARPAHDRAAGRARHQAIPPGGVRRVGGRTIMCVARSAARPRRATTPDGGVSAEQRQASAQEPTRHPNEGALAPQLPPSAVDPRSLDLELGGQLIDGHQTEPLPVHPCGDLPRDRVDVLRRQDHERSPGWAISRRGVLARFWHRTCGAAGSGIRGSDPRTTKPPHTQGFR